MSELRTVVTQLNGASDHLDEISRMVTITNATKSELLKFAVDMEGKQVMSTGTSSTLKLSPKEFCFLTILTADGIEVTNLENFLKPDTRELPNIERFLVDSSARLYIAYRRHEKHKYALITRTYLNDAVGVLKHLTVTAHGVYSFKDNVIRFMGDTFINLPILKMNIEPECRVDRIMVNMSMSKGKDIYNDTKYYSKHRVDDDKYYKLSRLIAGFKISNDLQTVTLKLAIDPTVGYRFPNPWLLDELGIAKPFGITELTAKLEFFTEVYKLKRLIPRLGLPLKDSLSMDQIKLFGIGRFFEYYPKSCKVGSDLEYINKLYAKYNMHEVMRNSMNTSRFAQDHTNRNYIEFRFK